MRPRFIGIIGFGVIGQRWAAAFLHAGFEVRCFDPDPKTLSSFEIIRDGLMADLEAVYGTRSETGSFRFFTVMAEALKDVDFVQENGPEDLAAKRSLLVEIERHVRSEVVIASSSSALRVSDMQSACVRPERVLLAHPFNPAHVMPLVEIVGGEKTDPNLPEKMYKFYESIGKKPVLLNREITGHIALRLMGAMWREAIALARDGVASVEDIDRAFIYGPGPKWGLQGSFVSNGLNASGMADFLNKYGPTYTDIWADLGTAELDEKTRKAVCRAVDPIFEARGMEQLRRDRDSGVVDMLKVVAQKGVL